LPLLPLLSGQLDCDIDLSDIAFETPPIGRDESARNSLVHFLILQNPSGAARNRGGFGGIELRDIDRLPDLDLGRFSRGKANLQSLQHRDLKLRAFASAEQDRMDVASELLFEKLLGAFLDAAEHESLGALRRGLTAARRTIRQTVRVGFQF